MGYNMKHGNSAVPFKTLGSSPAKQSDFGSAFATARKAGEKEFTYKGKKYHTKIKEEVSDIASQETGVIQKTKKGENTH